MIPHGARRYVRKERLISPYCVRTRTDHSYIVPQLGDTRVDLVSSSSVSAFELSLCFHRTLRLYIQSVLHRQAMVTVRNKVFVMTRVFSAVITSVILGSVWYQLPKEKGFEKLGMLLFSILHISFSNFSELTFSVEQKYVAYKQLDMKMFPALTYMAAWGIVHLPIAIVETAIFSLVLYPMVGLVLTAGNWIFFYFNLLLANIAMASFFRVVALLAPNMVGPTRDVTVCTYLYAIVCLAHLYSPDRPGGPWFLWGFDPSPCPSKQCLACRPSSVTR